MSSRTDVGGALLPVLSVPALQRQARRRLIRLCLWLGFLTVLTAAVLTQTSSNARFSIAAVLLIPALLVWLWQQPVRGVYFLFGAAVVQETQYTAVVFSDDLGRFTPFFQDLATWTHVKSLSFSLAEVFMLTVTLIWILKGIAARDLRFERGTLLRWLGLYLGMVAFAELHGLSSGGDFKVSLWEVRSQVYMLIAYILTANLVRTRRQVQTVLWILVLGAGLKALQGTWRYLITLHGNINGIESIFPHEQSFFFNISLTITALLFLYGGSARLKRACLWLLPFVAIASLANQRRAAILAIGVAFLVIGMITLVAYPARRRLVVSVAFVLALLLPPYYLAFANQSGLIAEPARAIASAFTPDQRDAASNLYRINEDKDIMATVRSSPILGYGFGKPMLVPFPLADISGSYVFWNIMPHDSILWIWMRMGTIGYALFWLLISAALRQAGALACRLRDPALKGLAVLLATIIVQEVILGYLDLQWVNYRNLITIGVCFALIGTLHRFEAAERLERGAV